jgi:hypothetical protein
LGLIQYCAIAQIAETMLAAYEGNKGEEPEDETEERAV